MSAPCYNFIMEYDENVLICENDTTNELKCKDCDSWCGGYICPSNDEIYYYRIDKGLDTGYYKPDMSKEETIEWFKVYKRKHKLA